MCQGTRRALRAFGLAAVATGAFVSPATAATVDVACGDVAGLRAAIVAANATAAADTIALGDCSYVLTGPAVTAPSGDTGLPTVTAPLIIDGNGATIQRAGTAPPFRLLLVNRTSLALRDLELRGGRLTEGGQHGGAIGGFLADIVLDRLTIGSNATINGAGGGITVVHGSLTVRDTTLALNQAQAGAGMYVFNAPADVRGSTLTLNRASLHTGGALVHGTTATFANDTFSRNVADAMAAGGLTVVPFASSQSVVPAEASVIASTFADNGQTGATAPGGALIAAGNEGNATIEVTDSIVADRDGTGPGPACWELSGGVVEDLTGNVEWPNDTCGFGTIGDPRLGSLADNGGLTWTHLPQRGSAALDAAGEDCVPIDQRGLPRPVDELCDAGAVEITPPQTFAEVTQSPTNAPEITFTAEPEDATFECSVDGGEFESCASPYRPQLADGERTVAVRAVGSDGHVDPTPAEVTVVVDRTAPETTITSGPPARTTDTSVAFTFVASEESATFECRLDSGAWSACTSPHTVSGYGNGAHTFAVRAIDELGNADPTPATRRFTKCFLRLGALVCV